MSTTHFAQNQQFRLSSVRRLHILVAALALARAVSIHAAGVYFQNSTGLVSPSNHITFSEFSPPPNTVITTQYQAFRVTFAPNVYYASIYNQNSGTPHIDPAACVANFVQFGTVVPTLSVVFDRPVSAAAFAVLTQPGTFQVTALWAGTEVPGGPHTFTGGMGPNATTNFVGFSGVPFDELRINNVATSDGALVLDNLQFTPTVVNSWTNPVSGRWDASANWSLATLPASNQTVSIANTGYKAIDLDGATFANFPASVTVSNLLVTAPANALSTLLLNFAGLNTPLKVLNDCTIGPNGTLDNFSSSFEVDGHAGGELDIAGGTFTQVGGQTVVNAPVLVRNGGSVNATNGNLTLGDVTLGTTSSTGNFNQDGGSIAAQHVIVENGTYTMASGTLYGIGGTEIDAPGYFAQWGGTNYGDITVNSGQYTINGGLAKGNVLTIDAGFYQGGGVVDMQTVNWASINGNAVVYGTLRSQTINIYGDALVFLGQGNAVFGTVETDSLNISNALVELQNYNLFVTNDLTLHGASGGDRAYLEFSGGMLRAGAIDVQQNSVFDQFDGTTELTTGLTAEGATCTLWSGLLEGPYVNVGPNAGFAQLGGQNLVHGVLSITGSYAASRGSLVADGIYLRGLLLLQEDTTANFPELSFTNNGLLDLGGVLEIGLTNAWGGQVRLSANAALSFIRTPAQINFASSSAIAWTPGSLLVVSNWNSSTHVFFGTDASGLSASQLRQIAFSNPGGFAPGNYPAHLLSTGELVPAPLPTLQSTHSGSGLVLNWPSGYQLLSATNINGPYTPVSGASSPWTNHYTKPKEFFKVQGL